MRFVYSFCWDSIYPVLCSGISIGGRLTSSNRQERLTELRNTLQNEQRCISFEPLDIEILTDVKSIPSSLTTYPIRGETVSVKIMLSCKKWLWLSTLSQRNLGNDHRKNAELQQKCADSLEFCKELSQDASTESFEMFDYERCLDLDVWLYVTITFSQEFSKKRNKTHKGCKRCWDPVASYKSFYTDGFFSRQFSQQPLAGSHREDYEKLQGNVAKVAGSLRQVPVEVEELRCEVFVDGVLAMFGMDSFIIYIKNIQKPICMWYTVCTNISKLICFGVGILRARQNFRSPTKTP